MTRLVAATLLAASLSAPAQASEEFESFDLKNTKPELLATEFVGSVFLGFVLPDLVVPRPPDPLTCADAWCEPPGFDVAISNLITLDNPKSAGHISHVFTMGLTPAAVFASQIYGAAKGKDGWHAVEDFVIIMNAWSLSTGLNSVAKLTGRRQRPAFYFDREGNSEAGNHPDEEFLSFYSGDTTWAWTFMAAGTTLAYLRGYKHRKILAYTTAGLAFIGSTLRIVGDMHWATDVLTGAVIGGAVGFGVPFLLHRRKPVDMVRVKLGVDVGRDRRGLALTGRW